MKQGQPGYGMGAVGAGKDTEGSDAILRALDKEDDRPQWVASWGGANTLAQALHTLRATRPSAEVDRLGAAYLDVAWGTEGDTSSFLGLIPNGLGDPEHPEWGGWGGRYHPPVPVLDHPDTLTVRSGEGFGLGRRVIVTVTP